MFLLRSSHPEPPRPALTASATQAPDQPRRARQLRQCEELAELGMELARAAQREALRDMQPRPPRRAAVFPELPAPPDYRDPAFGHLFTQLSRCIRQTILLETRLAAGAYDTPDQAPGRITSAPPPPSAPPQSNRCAPDAGPRLRPEQLEDESRTDAHRPAEDILAGICAEFGAAREAGLSPLRPGPEATRQHDVGWAQPTIAERDPIATLSHPPPGPPRLSQAERAMLAFQQGIPPPTPTR